MGEDSEVSDWFLKQGADAEFRILEPHRAAPYGSGVALWLCDADRNNAVRVGFADREGQDGLFLSIRRFRTSNVPHPTTELILEKELSLKKANTNAVRLSTNAGGDLIVVVAGQVISVVPGFGFRHVVAQVYCAKGWIRFIDGPRIS